MLAAMKEQQKKEAKKDKKLEDGRKSDAEKMNDDPLKWLVQHAEL